METNWPECAVYGESVTEPDCNAHAEPYRNSNSIAEPKSVAHGHANAITNSDTCADTLPYSTSKPDAYAYADADSGPTPDGQASIECVFGGYVVLLELAELASRSN